MIVNMCLQIMIRSFGKWTFKRLEDFVRRKAHELINAIRNAYQTPDYVRSGRPGEMRL